MDPYEQGAAARRAGQKLAANPYKGKPSLHEQSGQWVAGWQSSNNAIKAGKSPSGGR